jgi:hypothetical protein
MMKRAARGEVAAFIEFLIMTAVGIQSPLRAGFFTGR